MTDTRTSETKRGKVWGYTTRALKGPEPLSERILMRLMPSTRRALKRYAKAQGLKEGAAARQFVVDGLDSERMAAGLNNR